MQKMKVVCQTVQPSLELAMHGSANKRLKRTDRRTQLSALFPSFTDDRDLIIRSKSTNQTSHLKIYTSDDHDNFYHVQLALLGEVLE